MFSCNFCGKSVKSLRGYVLHCKLHRNEPRCLFKCFAADCKQTFVTYASFKAHFYRKHNVSAPVNVTVGTAAVAVKCAVALCERQCQDAKSLISHLKEHIVEGRAVSCPVRGCTDVFKVKSSFTSHMSRKHRDFTESRISDLYRDLSAYQSSSQSLPTELHDSGPEFVEAGTDEGDTDTSGDFSDLFLRNVCLFYLKLQGQFLLPASTTQHIVEEIQNIHELGQTFTLSKLTALLKNKTSLSDGDIANICQSVRESDLFTDCHTGPMRTAHSRAQCFKKMFNYVEPKKVFLGRDENRIDRCAYYVPVKETLKCLLQSDMWQNCESEEHSAEPHSDVLTDVTDGQMFKSNDFFGQNPSSLRLVLYQDAFEVVNPLGSAKTRHKVLAVYLSVANLPLHVRSDTNHMSLVLLCREKDFKQFGHAKVFSDLLADLKELEENGIAVSDETVVKGTLYCIAGDNLGSHCIGGFCENFSRAEHFCRYCLITRSEFQGDDPNVCGPARTIENYNSAVERIQTEDTQDVVEGVKFKSVFNSLKYFNVCQPGLPPCLGHDIFEGILSYDLALYLKYFIKKKHGSHTPL